MMKHMMHKHFFAATLSLAALSLVPALSQAQTNYTENFTGAATSNSWYFFNGACLTAGGSSSTASPGVVPSCIGIPYYSNKGDPRQVGGNTGTLPDDPAVGGALRFTNGYPYGYNENGAILSNFNFATTNGLQVTFTTETYEGDSGGGGSDGADGISFFLQSVDQGQTPDLGAFGGSLGYSCSNNNNDPILRASGQPRGYDGLIGGYIGLGIDEYGNFLNGGDNTSTSASTGNAYQWNRIGLRGAGSTAWSYLNATYPAQYPATLTFAQRAAAVRQACQTGFVWDYSSATPVQTATTLPNYAAIPGAFRVLSGVKIANEAAIARSGSGPAANYGVPITYNLKITTAGLLSLSYSYNGGVYQPVITGQDISASNGRLPNNVRFGFAGSSGGSTNIHEIMCFQAAPVNQTSSSAGVNQKQSAKVQVGTQVYFAFYNSDNWTGSLTSQTLIPDPMNPINLILSSAANWDASCVLTGVPTGQTCTATGVAGLTNPEVSANRTILTLSGAATPGGIAFQWGNLTATQQAALDAGDVTPPAINANRLSYLRGDRTNEVNSAGVGLFRARTSVLGDIIDSSPTWVGPPSVTYITPWHDSLTAASMPENSGGAQTYAAFMTAQKTRTNVVYAGANDGMLHGFRSGSFDASGNYVSTNNDGQEVLAYLPGYILNNININANPSNNYSNTQYAHRFDVDATPGTGDLFYGNAWHTWLVSGLGQGGNAIFALDITNPSGFSESGAAPASTVIGEWSTTTTVTTVAGPPVTTTTSTSSTLACVNVANCGYNLGRTYGIPQIRRFHNGQWGAVFGNGFSSSTGDAGIYVMLADPSSGAPTFYYLSTHQAAGAGDGIAFTAPVDLDGDAVIDFVYAGDLLGHVWRFDLTNSNPNSWAVVTTPIFTTPGNQPISTQIQVVGINSLTGGNTRLMLEFGTGRQVPFNNVTAATYSTTQQALYGIWDWSMATWNTVTTQPLASLPSGSVTAPASALTLANLQLQTITATFDATLTNAGNAFRTVSNNSICWADNTGCTGTAAKFGWYMQLPIGPADPTNPSSPTVAEQVTFSPAILSGVFVVNTTVPPTNTPQTCSSTAAASWLMALDPASGGALAQPYLEDAHHNSLIATGLGVYQQGASGAANVGTGSPSEVIGNGNQHYLILSPSSCTTGNCSGGGVVPQGVAPISPAANTSVKRLTWIQKR
jgi:type IV pilus assembly protein PilY1